MGTLLWRVLFAIMSRTAVDASTLRLSGPGDSQILFGSDPGSAAVLSAHCGAAARPTFLSVDPSNLTYAPGLSLEILLGNVAPSCLAVANWRTTPCSTLNPNDKGPSPSFFCHWRNVAGVSVFTGPSGANTELITSSGIHFGHVVKSACPVPSLDDLMMLRGVHGLNITLNVSISYGASRGPDAIDFEWGGAHGQMCTCACT